MYASYRASEFIVCEHVCEGASLTTTSRDHVTKVMTRSLTHGLEETALSTREVPDRMDT